MINILSFVKSIFKSKDTEDINLSIDEKYPFLKDIPTYNSFGMMTIEDLIGAKVTNVLQDFTFNKIGGWLDFSASFIEINNKYFIRIPYSGAEKTEIYEIPKSAKKIDEDILNSLVNQKISNIYFEFYENEPDSSQNAYIELDNKYVITETGMAPHGTGGANFFLYTPEEFKELISDPVSDIRSFKSILYA